jgi:hypothetical protein
MSGMTSLRIFYSVSGTSQAFHHLARGQNFFVRIIAHAGEVLGLQAVITGGAHP